MPSLRLLVSVLVSLVFAAVAPAADTPARKRVAIVMDDGPIPEHNAAYLALFAREGVKITFSHVGKNVVAHPELTKASAAAGHEIADHSYTHSHMKEMPDDAIIKEIADTQAAVKAATGRAPAWFWAPFLEHDDRVDAAVRKAGGIGHFPFMKYHFISTNDWEASTTPEKFRELMTTGIVDGTVILTHEWPKVTFENLEGVIAELKRQNVEFVTFSELAAHP
jgi:peptidoglycan/xylan/chitin deacetylase (PgdA/CDA1 family)